MARRQTDLAWLFDMMDHGVRKRDAAVFRALLRLRPSCIPDARLAWHAYFLPEIEHHLRGMCPISAAGVVRFRDDVSALLGCAA